jgi:hypothetical protein
MNTQPTPETSCADCGSTEESYFSRIGPMGYFCPDCGHEEGKPVERQCDNQGDQMTKLIEQLDEARKWSSKLADVGDDLRAERDEARAEIKMLKTNLEISFRQTEQAVQDRADEHQILTAQRDRLAEALREIEWSNNSEWQSDRAREALAAVKG